MGRDEPTKHAHPVLRTRTSETACSDLAGEKDVCSGPATLRALQQFIVEVDEAGGEQRSAGEERSRTGGERRSAGEERSRTGTAAAAGPRHPVVRRAARVLGCATEFCVVTHSQFLGHAAAGPGGPEAAARLEREAAARFKPAGPRDSRRLLSNFDIDGVLQQWAAHFPRFYNFDFNMMDFETTGGSLARTDLVDVLEGRAPQNLGPAGGTVARRCDTFACVLNTDVSTGRGKHWVAVFGDCRAPAGSPRPWTVEYFNSAGNPPPPPVGRWMGAAAARLQRHRGGAVETVPVTGVRHQSSQTECGLYVLYYIRRRLEGGKVDEFRADRLPDSAMVEFRRHVFRGGEDR